MKKELYFDISSAQSGGSLFRVEEQGKIYFLYSHSTYDDRKDELKVFETVFETFGAFWLYLSKDPEWFYLHPLFVHPEQRNFITEQLKQADWEVQAGKKWQESHQRQWKKVLHADDNYYRAREI